MLVIAYLAALARILMPSSGGLRSAALAGGVRETEGRGDGGEGKFSADTISMPTGKCYS